MLYYAVLVKVLKLDTCISKIEVHLYETGELVANHCPLVTDVDHPIVIKMLSIKLWQRQIQHILAHIRCIVKVCYIEFEVIIILLKSSIV